MGRSRRPRALLQPTGSQRRAPPAAWEPPLTLTRRLLAAPIEEADAFPAHLPRPPRDAGRPTRAQRSRLRPRRGDRGVHRPPLRRGPGVVPARQHPWPGGDRQEPRASALNRREMAGEAELNRSSGFQHTESPSQRRQRHLRGSDSCATGVQRYTDSGTTKYFTVAKFTWQTISDKPNLCLSATVPQILNLTVKTSYNGGSVTDSTEIDYPPDGLPTYGFLGVQLEGSPTSATDPTPPLAKDGQRYKGLNGRIATAPVTVTSATNPTTVHTSTAGPDGCAFFELPVGTYKVKAGNYKIVTIRHDRVPRRDDHHIRTAGAGRPQQGDGGGPLPLRRGRLHRRRLRRLDGHRRFSGMPQ